MYKAVAEEPHGKFHSEMGKTWPRRLGYPAEPSSRSPGWVTTRAWPLSPRASGPPDLGSGPGTDLFLAARQAGAAGEVIGMQTGCKAARPG